MEGKANKGNDKEIDPFGTKESEKQLLIQESALLKPYRVEVFAAVVNLLNSMKIKWWISDGTLLGWYRNNQSILPYDYDMDIGVIEDDIQAVWKNRAKLPTNIELQNVCPQRSLLHTTSSYHQSRNLVAPFFE
uniref:LicD/FKTN/FKRP nucleotidyltransferase domain-containing protein n=1 Tax=Amphimedon queenslandica TaxID=400682 RepID=A0A1X7UCL4_AMPQE